MPNNTFDAWEGEHLEHYGVLGQKWGMRRYQNPDGSLTAAGKRHYAETGEYGYHYKSHATKKYTRKARRAMNKAEAYDVGSRLSEKNGKVAKAKKMNEKATRLAKKANKYLNRAKRSSEVDKGEQEYAKGLSTGKALALTILGGGQYTKGYAQYRAMAGQKGKGFTGQKAMAGVKAYRSGSYGSRIAKAAYIRQDEGKKGLGQKAYKINKAISDAGARLIDTAAGTSSYPNKKRRRG